MIRDADVKQFAIAWYDACREAKMPPNPAFPEGVDIVMVREGSTACRVALPYPALRCGHYVIECLLCGLKIGATTAGRVDDPRSIAVECKATNGAFSAKI